MGFHSSALGTDQMEEKDLNIYQNKGLDKEKEVNNLLNKLSETDNYIEPGLVLDSKYSVKEPSSEDSSVVNDKYTEGMVQELRDCLPVWVSQDQVLDLLTRSGGNIVEAVSDFYERETEYHELVIAFRTSSAISQKSLLTVPASLPNELVSDKATSNGSVGSPLSQEKKKASPTPNISLSSKSTGVGITLSHEKTKTSPTPNISRSSKSIASPRKRGSAVGLQSKAKKKVKPSSTLQPPSGSKQSTITKFFSKVLPNAS